MSQSTERNRKCLQCGAPVPTLTLSCPFCGGNVTEPQRDAKELPQPESVFSAIISTMDGGISNLRREAKNVPDSPEDLVTFFSRHIGGTGQLHYGPIHRQACEAALTKLRVLATNDTHLSRIADQLQRQLEQAPKVELPVKFFAICLSFCAIAFVLSVMLAFFGLRWESNTRSEITELIREGRFAEARILATELSSSADRKSILESIDKAESQEAWRK